MAPTGYKVDPEALDKGAEKLDTIADKITDARETLLSKENDLPTLDPLHNVAVAVAGSFGPFMPRQNAPGVGLEYEVMARVNDPYPRLRAAWGDALGRYSRMVGADAKRMRNTADEYRSRETESRGHIDGVGA